MEKKQRDKRRKETASKSIILMRKEEKKRVDSSPAPWNKKLIPVCFITACCGGQKETFTSQIKPANCGNQDSRIRIINQA